MAEIESAKTGRVAKNTALLYLRMLLIMVITLYTTRVVLSILGASDYGIFDVVAGVISMLTFVNSAMSASTQRFFSYALGENNYTKLKSVFSASINIYILLSVIVLLLGETLGFWFVNSKLTIPNDRILAANCIYQFSLLSCVVSMMSVPFSSAIIAHEKMNVYAIVGILDCSLRLLLVYLLTVISFDKLFLYGFLQMLVHVIVAIIYAKFARKQFAECHYSRIKDIKLHIDILSFSGWSLWGAMTFVGNNQGCNILLNMFFDPVINASRAIATQISSAISSFSNSFFMALRPPIIKAYAENDRDLMMKLFYLGNKYTYYLLIMICIPCIINIETILQIWLSESQPHLATFARLSIIYSIIMAMQNPITIIIQATGDVKKYFLLVDSLTLLTIPLSYVLLKMGLDAECTYYSMIGLFILAHYVRLLILKEKIVEFSILKYLIYFLVPAVVISVVLWFSLIFINCCMKSMNTYILFIFDFIFSIIITMLFVYCFALDAFEKKNIKTLLKRI